MPGKTLLVYELDKNYADLQTKNIVNMQLNILLRLDCVQEGVL